MEALATQLLTMGLEPQSRMAILAETRYEWYVSYLAGINSGMVMVPLDIELQDQELLSLFNRSASEAIITSSKFADRVKDLAPQIPSLKDLILINNMAQALDPKGRANQEEEDQSLTGADGHQITFHLWNNLLFQGRQAKREGNQAYRQMDLDPKELAVLLFTSGTTDKSKCVMHSQQTIVANIMGMGQVLFIGKNQDDTLLSVLPLNHTYECTCGFLYQIYKGDTIAQSEGLRHIPKNMTEAKVTTLLCVPLLLESLHRIIWKNIKKSGKEKLVRRMMTLSGRIRKIGLDLSRTFFKAIHQSLGGHMRTFISGGAAIDPQILQDFYDWGFVAVQGYGLTEFAPILALNREKYFRHDSAGLPLPDNQIKILDPDENGVGEILGKGPNMMLGYYGAPELTNEVIVDGWYHTGDMGYLTEEGFLIITGRKKNTIITKNGKNIFPEELEAVLNRNPEIAESLVYAIARDKGDDLLAVEIFPDKEGIQESLGKEAGEEEILEHMKGLVQKLNQQTPSYQAIRQVIIRDKELPKNTSRKILRDYSKDKK